MNPTTSLLFELNLCSRCCLIWYFFFHTNWRVLNHVTLQGVHQPGDPGGHWDQTQPSLPDQRRGLNPASGLCCHGDRLRRGGASGLQLKKGRGVVWLGTGAVTRNVNQGGAQRRHPGSAGEHPQRPGDVRHSVRRHRRADVGRLRLSSPEKLSPGGRPAAPAPLMPSCEPLHRRPSLSCRQQRHPLRLREKQLSGLHRNNPEHLHLNLSQLFFSSCHLSFAAFATHRHSLRHRQHLFTLVCLLFLPANLLSEQIVRVLPLRFIRWWFMFTPWCKMPWLLKQKKEEKKRERARKKKTQEVQIFHENWNYEIRWNVTKHSREMVIAGKAEDACRGCLPRMRRVFLKMCEWMWTLYSVIVALFWHFSSIYIRTTLKLYYLQCAWVCMSHSLCGRS